ncbi:MAG: putative Ig domain-containing protein [Ignavibacteria bacterium]|nr:putative Ig domain-containing protein [Ignavibacteria bacterium]
MNKIYSAISAAFVLCMVISGGTFAQAIPVDSMYLGQSKPDYNPKIFNLPINGGLRPMERIAITHDGKELYYSELNNYPPSNFRIKCFKYQNNHWVGPTVAFESFFGVKLSPDDSTIFMQRDVNNITVEYVAHRSGNGWTTPVKLFSKDLSTHYFQVTGLNHMYCSSNGANNMRDLYYMYSNGTDTLMQNLGAPINTPDYDENDFFVAPDESYMLLSRSNAGVPGDIFVAYKKTNGKWTNPKNLGSPINTDYPNWEYGHHITDDGKYLFFSRGGVAWNSYNVYWVRFDHLLDSLKHTNFDPYMVGTIPTQNATVGKMFTYTIPDTMFNDDDGNSQLTYTVNLANGNPLPAWLTYNNSTKTFSGVPVIKTNLSIMITVSDSIGTPIITYMSLKIAAASGVSESTIGKPGSLILEQNYPNPFNPATTIRFNVPQQEHVTLRVYNMLGKEVAVLINQVLNPREYSIVFSANNLASGTYIYSLRAGNDVINREMVLLK